MALAPRDLTVSITAESRFVHQRRARFDSRLAAGRRRGATRCAPGGWSGRRIGLLGLVDEQGRIVEATQLGNLTLRRMA